MADGVSLSQQADRASASAVVTVLRHMRGPDDLLGLAMMEAHERIQTDGYDGQTVATAVQILPDGSVETAIAGDVELWILLSDGNGNYDAIPYATSRRDSAEAPSVVLGGPQTPRLVDQGPPGGQDEIVRKPIPNITLEDQLGSEGLLLLKEGDGILLMTDGLARYYHLRPSVQMSDLISGKISAEGIRKAIQADASGRLETLRWRRSIKDGGGIQRVPPRSRFRIPEGKPMAGRFIDGAGLVYDARKGGKLIGYFGEEDNQTALVYIHRPSLREEPVKHLAPQETPEKVRSSIPPAPYEDDEPTPAVFTTFSLEADSREDLIRRYASHFEPNGFFVQNSRIPAGSDIRFEVKLKTGEVVLGGRGLVAWTRASGGANRNLPPGMFVQILDLETSTRPFFQYILSFKNK